MLRSNPLVLRRLNNDYMNAKDKKYLEDHRYYASAVMFSTQYPLSSPYANTTVLRTPDVVQRGMLGSTDSFRGIDYLLNFRLDGSDIAFRAGLSKFYARDAILSSALRHLREDDEASIRLPKPIQMKASLSAVIKERRSERNYSGQALSIKELSTILFSAQGVTGSLLMNEPEGDVDRIEVRAHPSGGGMFPVSLYVGVNNVSGLKRGLFEYYPHSHSLHYIGSYTEENLADSCDYGSLDAKKSSFAIFYGYNVLLNSNKYGDAGLAYAFIETGEMAMNAQLAATALGIGACDLGGYRKHNLEEMLGLDGVYEHIIHMTIFGQI